MYKIRYVNLTCAWWFAQNQGIANLSGSFKQVKGTEPASTRFGVGLVIEGSLVRLPAGALSSQLVAGKKIIAVSSRRFFSPGFSLPNAPTSAKAKGFRQYSEKDRRWNLAYIILIIVNRHFLFSKQKNPLITHKWINTIEGCQRNSMLSDWPSALRKLNFKQNTMKTNSKWTSEGEMDGELEWRNVFRLYFALCISTERFVTGKQISGKVTSA